MIQNVVDPNAPSAPLAIAAPKLLNSQQLGNPNSRPPGWFIDGGPKILTPAPDQPQGGKYFCSALLRHGHMSKREFLMLANGHFVAYFTHGDFANWYRRNGKKIVQNADAKKFDWQTVKSLAVDRTIEIFHTEGMSAAIENYMKFSETMYRLHGLKDKSIEPFQRDFYFSSKRRRLSGTFHLFQSLSFWKDLVNGFQFWIRSPKSLGGF